MHAPGIEISDADLTHPVRLYPHFVAYHREPR